jgi:two-component system response regulator RegX3
MDAPGRELPFSRELVGSFADSVLSTSESELASVQPGCREDFVVLARSAWEREDTELCRCLSESQLGPVLIGLAGQCDLGERAEALRAGASELLCIPFAPEEVRVRTLAVARRARIHELVVRAFTLVHGPSNNPGYARVGAFLVDFGRRQVFVEGQRVPMTLREYDVLAMLVERSGEVVTRRELAERIDSTAASGSNIVDVHVSRIRDKLANQASAIETIRGVGYRFRPR